MLFEGKHRYKSACDLLYALGDTCRDIHHDIVMVSPEMFLEACGNIVNNSPEIIAGNTQFDIIWNRLISNDNPCVIDLKVIVGLLYEDLDDIVKDYFTKARAYQEPFIKYACYLSKEQAQRFRNIYCIHYSNFISRFTKVIVNIRKDPTISNIYTEIEAIKKVIVKILPAMSNYALTNKEIKEFVNKINSGKAFELIQTCYNSFGDSIPVNKVFHLVKFHMVNSERDCDVVSILDYAIQIGNEDGTTMALHIAVDELREYKAEDNPSKLQEDPTTNYYI